MKTAAKVFIIIGMITGWWTVLAIVFGAIAFKKLNNNQMTTAWAVLTLIFVNVLAGIFLLCMPKNVAPAEEVAPETTAE